MCNDCKHDFIHMHLRSRTDRKGEKDRMAAGGRKVVLLMFFKVMILTFFL